MPLSAAARVRDRLIFGTALAYYHDVTAAIADERPDVILTDYLLLGGYVAAERAGIPLASLIHTVFPLPAVPERSVVRPSGSPPFAMRSKLGMPVASFCTRGSSPLSVMSRRDSSMSVA